MSGRPSWWPWNLSCQFISSAMLHGQCSQRSHNHKLRIVEPLAAVRENDWVADSKGTTINVVTVVYFISNVPQSSTLFRPLCNLMLYDVKEMFIVYCVLSYQGMLYFISIYLIISLIVDKKCNGLEHCFIVLDVVPVDRFGNLLETVHKWFMLLYEV